MYTGKGLCEEGIIREGDAGVDTRGPSPPDIDIGGTSPIPCSAELSPLNGSRGCADGNGAKASSPRCRRTPATPPARALFANKLQFAIIWRIASDKS